MLAIFLTPGLLPSSTRLANQAVVRLQVISGLFSWMPGSRREGRARLLDRARATMTL